MERWLPVIGYEFYEVSDLGRVRSTTRVVTRSDGAQRRYTGRLLSPGLRMMDRPPRYQVTLNVNGVGRTKFVHHLVLEAFVGPRPEGTECCHGPGGSLDNRLVNLRWDTHASNMEDRERDGGTLRGAQHYATALTEDQAREALALRAAGWTQKQVAEKFSTTACVIRSIENGRTWKTLTGGVPRPTRYAAKGEAHGRSKLTNEQVREIRAAENVRQVDLAKRYGVSQVAISLIRRRVTYTDVE